MYFFFAVICLKAESTQHNILSNLWISILFVMYTCPTPPVFFNTSNDYRLSKLPPSVSFVICTSVCLVNLSVPLSFMNCCVTSDRRL